MKITGEPTMAPGSFTQCSSIMKSYFYSFALFLISVSFVQASVLVTNGLTHRHDVRGVDKETGYIVLKNIGDEPERVLVYFKDLNVGCTGSHQYLEAGSTERSNASWLKVGFEERILQPGEEFPMRYEVNVPKKPLKGSFWSLIMVEVKKPIDTTQLEYGVRVSSNVRYAIQIITDFEPAVAANVEFESVEMRQGPHGDYIDVTLKNFGDMVLIPEVKIEVYNASGELVLEKKADTKKLYPTQCRAYQVPVQELEKGKYQGVLVADCGESDLFGMTLNLEVDD
ncbi:MAG: hypothetical protein U5L96_08070 [Owenweeksia sp.]|nr:hypothetical protein [Owenweeksia sp.]